MAVMTGKVEKRRRPNPQIGLFVAILSIALLWCWLLPSISNYPTVKQRLDGLDDQGIDGGAMFYTELDVMDRILHRIER